MKHSGRSKVKKTRRRSFKGLYRWFKSVYLPRLHRKIELLPEEVASLANQADGARSSFYIL